MGRKKGEYDTKPTIKQTKAFMKAYKEGKSIRKAMQEAGYSTLQANKVKVKKTKGWQQLLKKYLPDDLLAKVHREGLEATRKDFDREEMAFVDSPDYPTRHKYLDTAYKVKGTYAPEKHDHTSDGKPLQSIDLGKILNN